MDQKSPGAEAVLSKKERISLKLGIVGGGLQGIEAAYLAGEAGFQTLLIDQRDVPPARNLCQEFVNMRVERKTREEVKKELEEVEAVLPALEDYEALNLLTEIEGEIAPPVIFSREAYDITHCKRESRQFFQRESLPHAKSWPEADYPLIIKPLRSSGSEGVKLIENERQLEALLKKHNREDIIIEEFISGPAYSLEVIARGDEIYPLKTTRLEFTDDYDCCSVTAGAVFPEELEGDIKELSRRAASGLNLEGIMDLEFIAGKEELILMEMDARFPSQTPIAVYEAYGLNMVADLVGLFARKDPAEEFSPDVKREGAAIYEVVCRENGRIYSSGEHIMAKAEELDIREDFLGADKAITDWKSAGENWRAVLIFSGSDLVEAQARRSKTWRRLKRD